MNMHDISQPAKIPIKININVSRSMIFLFSRYLINDNLISSNLSLSTSDGFASVSKFNLVNILLSEESVCFSLSAFLRGMFFIKATSFRKMSPMMMKKFFKMLSPVQDYSV